MHRIRTILAVVALSCASAGAPALAQLVYTPLADGFDFPVGKPDGAGFHKARGFRSGGHLGEDWNGPGGGDSDLGAPVYAAGRGLVVLARDIGLGWGNVVIVRHAYHEEGRLKQVDSLYGHLHDIWVREGQAVERGQRVGSIGNNRGMYDAHLHFEMRSNPDIGMNRGLYARDFTNYHDPTDFISSRRTLRGGPAGVRLSLNTAALLPRSGAGAARLPQRRAAGPVVIHPPPRPSSAVVKERILAGPGYFRVERFGDLLR